MLDFANKQDNFYFPRSLVVACVHQEHGQLRTRELQGRWESVRYQRSSLQRKLAKERNSLISPFEEGYEIRKIKQFQRILASKNIAIMIYNFNQYFQSRREFDV